MFIKKLTVALAGLLLLVMAFNIGWSIHDCYYDSIEILPQGELLYNSMSPDTETTVYIYKVDVPNGSAIRGTVVKFADGEITDEKNIYWEVGADNAMTGWITNNVVSINNNLIDVTTGEVYDSRYDIQAPETLTNN